MKPEMTNPLDPGQCQHNGILTYNGLQDDGHGGAFALYTCDICHTTLSAKTLRETRKREAQNE
jgi:hypothetical protein